MTEPPAAPRPRRALTRLLAAVPPRFRSEPVRFVMVGGVNSLFGFGVFALGQLTLGHLVHYLVILVVATVVAVLEAYVLQRWLVFRARGRWWRDLVRFSSVYAVSLAINVPALSFLVEIVKVPVVPAQGVVMVAVAFATYLVHRNFTFRHSRGGANRGATPGSGATAER